ncbi:hypothetical protein MYU51_004635 [Penicillium brevicompactum]|uniref:Peptidase C19 ubiquitin carboxyl-terminal hydrolase 2 n=1 Tax=Penicillium brevicompactum TaxID=5074 RepID=UPI002540D07D|nr:Peptidase C19 ubiquitin carboxyl-terminal hydrolase 2 [Penicillium brevicompactum]KAJ5334160.1 Peptidase C19 ubiquitin carboxyl-terminal hydrolase 2 [Penicillium brevicompactum]
MAPEQLAGKTAPRLVQDIQLYDPAHDSDTGLNLLSQTPPLYPTNYHGPRSWIAPNACQHEYVLKSDQTFVAQTAHRRRPGTSSKVSAMCSKCRCHLQVVVNYTSSMQASNQALKEQHLHHLVYKSGRQKNGLSMPEVTHHGQTAETFHYQCSHASCSAMVSLRILSPILGADYIHLMTDKDLLRKRAEEAFATYLETMEGMAKPEPINLLDNLRLYLTNALRNPQRSKPIASGNKRFVHVFGVEGAACKRLLEFLGFTYFEESGVWQPPRLPADAEKPYQDPLCCFIDDVVLELLALIHQRPSSEKRGIQFPNLPPSAIPDIIYALEANDYPKAARADEFEMASDSCYEDLGVVESMSAGSIVEAYKQQTAVDVPDMAPHYLTCLKQIAILRRGKDDHIIEEAIRDAYAIGQFSSEDVDEAYKFFDIDPYGHGITNTHILERFYSYLGSSRQETQARQELWRIGKSRNSERLLAASEDRVTNVEQANVFLGVENGTHDDFVLTMYTTKINDNPATKDVAHKALTLIAESRNSPVLNHFLLTGETPAGEMDVSDAYRLLQLPDGTVDDGAITAGYTICVDDNPGEADKYNQALVIIANHINSASLKAMAGISTEPERNMRDWPVGLQNIGNTCYLNSLLQFYFSVRPFREMVLDFERFQMDLNDEESLVKKQVGSRKVTKKEIERSMQFLRELRTLYIDMITSSQNSVTPGKELARLTLISPSNEAAIRRRSTITATRAQILGEINGNPILGPLGPPQPLLGGQVEQNGSNTANSTSSQIPTATDSETDTTMASTISTEEAPSVSAEGKENNPPGSDDFASDQTESGSSRPDIEMAIDPTDVTSTNPDTSNVPPPVPPRPIPEIDREKQLRDELEYGAQQDVTEVINNVLFQSQCAIKARGIDQDGEQIDQIKDLFYGKTRSYISTEKGTRSKDERWCDIKVDVAHGSRDIYDAIDGAFDVQKISVDNTVAEQHGSISHIPPVLQIQVQRVQFDPVKKTSFKSTNHLELLETIYMDRYMDTKNPEVVSRREQSWAWKATVKKLEDRREELLRKKENDGMDRAKLLDEARAALLRLEALEKDNVLGSDSSGLGIETNLAAGLESLAQEAKAELHAVDEQIKDTRTMIASQFADYHNLPYRLYAVFVHHGSVSFGHYYIYIFDFEKNIWRKYNDEYVTEVQNLDEIFKGDSTSNPPTPYFLVYVNSDMKERLVSPLCRELDEPMPDQADQPISTVEDSRAASSSEDVNMDPPAYDEVSTSRASSGMGLPNSPSENDASWPRTPVSG